jgi:TPR repeat protein
MRRLFLLLIVVLTGAVQAQNERLMPAIGAMKIGDYVQAIDTLKPLAEKGDTEAQFLLGLALESAPEAQRNLAAAHDWYLKAAGGGHVAAANNLGAMYYDGRGVGKDLDRAFELYKAAAEALHPEAQYNLALMYGRGMGVEADVREMARWLERAAKAGLAGAQAQLGISYLRGVGVSRNLETAHGLLLRAAEAGYKPAMRELVVMYKMGLGVPSDDAKAAMWAQKAQ